MKIYFNSLGQVTSTVTNDEPLRQGNVNNHCEAYFTGKNNVNFNAYITFTRSDGTKVEGVAMTSDATDNTKYTYTFADSWFFAKAGTTNATIKLVNGAGTVICSGTITFSIEQTEIVNDPTITVNQYNSLLSAVASKLAINKGIVAVADIEDEDADDYEVAQMIFNKEEGRLYQVAEEDDENYFDYVQLTIDGITANGDILMSTNTSRTSFKLGFNDKTKSYIQGTYTIGDVRRYKIHIHANEIDIEGTMYPDADNSRDIGADDLRFRDGYFSGVLGDGTYTVTIANIVDKNTEQVITGKKKFEGAIPETKEGRTYNSGRQLTDKQYVDDEIDDVEDLITAETSNREDADDELQDAIDGINAKIPSQASSSNQLADKDFVNSTVNSLASFYITKNADGDPFDSYSQLSTSTIVYSGGVQRTPTRNDYALVNADENHDGKACRYIYQGVYGEGGQWEFQFVVNNAPFTQAQLSAINSGITSTKVGQYDSTKTSVDNILNGTTVVPKAQGDKYGRDIAEFYQQGAIYLDITILPAEWVVDSEGGYKYTSANLKSTFGVLTAGDIAIFVANTDMDKALFDAYNIYLKSLGTTGTGEQAVTTAVIHADSIGSGTGEIPIVSVSVRIAVLPEKNHAGNDTRCITTDDLDENTLEFVNGQLKVKASAFTTQQGTTSNWANEVAEYMVYDSEMEELQFGIYCYFDGDIESGDDMICGRDFMIDDTSNIQDPDGVALFGGKSSSLVASSSVEISVQKILVKTPVADEVMITCESTTIIASGGYLFSIPNDTNNQPIYKAVIGSFVTDGGVSGTIKGTTNGIIDAQIPTGATVYIKVTLFK